MNSNLKIIASVLVILFAIYPPPIVTSNNIEISDTLSSDIVNLKRENLELTQEILDKDTPVRQKVIVKEVPLIRKKEIVYLRIDGQVHEFKLERDSKLNSFIINVDSLYKVILEENFGEPTEKNNFFQRIFYRKLK